MSEPIWCDIRQHYCRCHDYGRRCDDFDRINDYAEAKRRADQGARINGKPEHDLDVTGKPLKPGR